MATNLKLGTFRDVNAPIGTLRVGEKLRATGSNSGTGTGTVEVQPLGDYTGDHETDTNKKSGPANGATFSFESSFDERASPTTRVECRFRAHVYSADQPVNYGDASRTKVIKLRVLGSAL